MASAPAEPRTQSRTHFDVLSLPVRFALDLEELERRYREASRHWHPDRFGRAPASERAAVLQRATDLNQAYRVLKNEDRRAEYLLKLRGIDIAAEEPDKQKAMDPEFLMAVLELREELLEAQAAKDRARLQTLRRSVETRMGTQRAEIAAGFSRLEAGDVSVLDTLVKIVLEQRYYRRFLDEVSAHDDVELEAAEAASSP